MRNFFCGMMVGLILSSSMTLAAGLYDSKGNVQAPAGSQQSFDYYRGRQAQLDIAAMRRQQEQDRLNRAGRPPCP